MNVRQLGRSRCLAVCGVIALSSFTGACTFPPSPPVYLNPAMFERPVNPIVLLPVADGRERDKVASALAAGGKERKTHFGESNDAVALDPQKEVMPRVRRELESLGYTVVNAAPIPGKPSPTVAEIVRMSPPERLALAPTTGKSLLAVTVTYACEVSSVLRYSFLLNLEAALVDTASGSVLWINKGNGVNQQKGISGVLLSGGERSEAIGRCVSDVFAFGKFPRSPSDRAGYAEAYCAQGARQESSGQRAEAISSYETALQLDPKGTVGESARKAIERLKSR